MSVSNRQALIDADGVLKAHGFCDFTPSTGESVIDAPTDFPYFPRTVKWNGKEWEDYNASPSTAPFVEYSTFRSRFTDDEKAALFKAQQTSWQINDWINLAVAQNGVSLVSADAAAAKGAMVAMHVLTQERADAIFAP